MSSTSNLDRSSDARDASVSMRQTAEIVPVVAIGASSGGLKALEAFFRNMPSESGMAFVVAMHLSRKYESRLALILQSFTSMPVTQVSSAIELTPNNIYVIAPGQHLSVEKRRLNVASSAPMSGVIDHLFHSLAEDRQEDAVGIVLSGNGADGMLGLQAIKERGGLIFAQDPEDADYPAMPYSIIDTGLVDFTVPAEEMPARLMTLRDQAPRPTIPRKDPDEDRHHLREILDALQARTGYDFSHYKRSTLLRQINRRMLVTQADGHQAYAKLLHKDDEAEALFQNLLISVTHFFRDPAAFLTLEREVLPRLFQNAGPPVNGDLPGIRVWVPGCATGEEVYSLAMLLAERRDAVGARIPIQILASDIDEAALGVARRRRYPSMVTRGVSPERLERFFIKKEGAYEVCDDLRSLVVFSSHDVTRDPPFTRIDLLSCRNLLMYFEAGMQLNVLKRLAYSLRPGGYLFLGSAEGTDRVARYFTPVSNKQGLFRRTTSTRSPDPLDFFPLSAPESYGPPSARILSGSTSNAGVSGPDSVDPPSPNNRDDGEPSQRDLLLANQEMQSLNEELRSMMEELEVAKEELQSLNEELTTVNQELQNKIEEHRRVNNDLRILIESTHIATLFLDRKLKVVLFTPESTKLFNLVPVDIGRPLEHISNRLTYSGVLEDARQVLEDGVEVTREVQTQDETWYALRVMPYPSPDGPPDGVVLTFANITAQKKVEQISEDRFSLAFHAGPMAAAIVTRDSGVFLDVNHIFEEITGYPCEQVVGNPAKDFGLFFGIDLDPSLTDAPGDPALDEVETRIRTRSGDQRDLVVSTTTIDFGGRPCYLSLFHDVTERKHLEREILLVSDREQRRIGVDLHDGLGTHLTGVALMTRGLARDLRKGRVVDPEEMDEIAQLLGEGIEQARTLAQGLNPFLLEVRGLTIALTELAANIKDQTGIACTYEEEGDELALNSEHSMHLYRIAQEAVTNAVRHGKAQRIQIKLSKNERRYRLTIHDNGAGFQPAQAAHSKPAGMGLSIMRYRAEMIGARLDVTGSPGRGTTVSCTFRTPV